MLMQKIQKDFWSDLSSGWINKRVEKRNKKTAYSLTADELEGWLENISLSPEQLAVVQQDEDQMLINGSAGSGKSVTLLYKMLKVMNTEPEGSRILYVSFNSTLIQDAQKRRDSSPKYKELQDKHVVHMNTFHYMAWRLLKEIGKQVKKYNASNSDIRKKTDSMLRRTMVFIENFVNSHEHQALPREQQLYKTHAGSFFMEEILWMKANGYISEEQYMNCERSGRGNNPRLTKEQRRTIFRLYEEYHRIREEKYHGELDAEDYALLLLQNMDKIPDKLKYDHIFVDEVQDLQPMQIRALVKLAKRTLTMSGDTKQRIYKRSPYSFRELGIDIEGRRNRKLRTNYRSTKQIMALASSLSFLDTENDREDERNFVREGPKPQIRYHADINGLNRFLIKEIYSIREEDPGSTIAVIHRYDDDINALIHSPIKAALSKEFSLITTDQYARRFDYTKEEKPLFFTDAFSVKGLEFDYVFILHFDRDHYPNKKRIENLKKHAQQDTMSDAFIRDEDEIYNDEKKILYVALTRAKKKLYIHYSGSRETRISPFVRDFNTKDYEAKNFTKSRYGR